MFRFSILFKIVHGRKRFKLKTKNAISEKTWNVLAIVLHLRDGFAKVYIR